MISNKLIIAFVVFLLLVGMSIFITANSMQAKVEKKVIQEEKTETDNNLEIEDNTIEHAKLMALKAVSGKITGFELENKNGILLYEVEIINNNQKVEVLVSPETGSVVALEFEEDEKITKEEFERIDGLITEERAKQIALNNIKNGNVIGVEIERENGMVVYEVELIADGNRVEIEIDAETERILEVEWGEDD